MLTNDIIAAFTHGFGERSEALVQKERRGWPTIYEDDGEGLEEVWLSYRLVVFVFKEFMPDWRRVLVYKYQRVDSLRVVQPADVLDVEEIHRSIGKSAFWLAMFKEPPGQPAAYPGALCLYLIPKPPTFHGMPNGQAAPGVRFFGPSDEPDESEIALDCDKFLMEKLDSADPMVIAQIERMQKELCRGIMMLGMLMREMQIRIEAVESAQNPRPGFITPDPIDDDSDPDY